MRSKSTLTTFGLALTILVQECVAFVQGLAFWAAVLLPLVYLALLVSGSPTVTDPFAVSGLTTANVVSLLIGHGYGTPADRSG